MKIKKPLPDNKNWITSEIIQIICGFALAIIFSIIIIMLFLLSTYIYSPSGLQDLEGTYEYGLGTILVGWIPAIIGIILMPVNILLWINAIYNNLIISYILLILLSIVVIKGGANGLLGYFLIPLLLLNILFLFLQHHHINKNKIMEKDK